MHHDPQYRPTFAVIRCFSLMMCFPIRFSHSSSKRLARLLRSLESEYNSVGIGQARDGSTDIKDVRGEAASGKALPRTIENIPRPKGDADLHQMKDSHFAQTDARTAFHPALRSGGGGDAAGGNTGSISSDEWEPQPTSSGSVFFKHKVTGESRWVLPGAGAVAGGSAYNSVGSGQGMPNAAPG